MLPAEIIKKKRNKHELTPEEIEYFIFAYTRGEIPDYQMSALLMAIYFSGMTNAETKIAVLGSLKICTFGCVIMSFEFSKHWSF